MKSEERGIGIKSQTSAVSPFLFGMTSY